MTLLTTCRRLQSAFDTVHAAVIDCTGQDIGDSEHDAQVTYISTQRDLSGRLFGGALSPSN